MKYLKVDYEKCDGGKHCSRECEAACAKTLNKAEGQLHSAIRLQETAGPGSELKINVCDQCGECVAVCPVLALVRSRTGAVLVNKNTCVGCMQCIGFCPTVSMRQVPHQALVFKCISCTACSKACPRGALEIAERADEEVAAGQVG